MKYYYRERGKFFYTLCTRYCAGSQACADVEHSIAQPHTQVTCTLPPGTGLERGVLLLQESGALITPTSQVCPHDAPISPFSNS